MAGYTPATHDGKTTDEHGIASDENDAAVKLKRDINTPYAICLIAGVIIGSGIFVSPVSITEQCGSIILSQIVWVASGVLTLWVCLCFYELGGMFPAAGGEYAFIYKVLGPMCGFLNAWILFICGMPTFFAVLALTTVEYALQTIYGDCQPPDAAVRILSVLLLGELIMWHYCKYWCKITDCLVIMYIKNCYGIHVFIGDI